MSNEPQDQASKRDDLNLAARRARTKPVEPPVLSDSQQVQASRMSASMPWILRRFYEKQIDLSAELAARHVNLPLMTVIRFRVLDEPTRRCMATLATSDGQAGITLESDRATGFVHLSYTFGSMLTMRFDLDHLSGMDRTHWLEQMRRQQDSVAFLWGQARWEEDYLICATRHLFVNLYAFSHNGFEGAVRLTPDVNTQLLTWLENIWKADPASGEDTAKLLTW